MKTYIVERHGTKQEISATRYMLARSGNLHFYRDGTLFASFVAGYWASVVEKE